MKEKKKKYKLVLVFHSHFFVYYIKNVSRLSYSAVLTLNIHTHTPRYGAKYQIVLCCHRHCRSSSRRTCSHKPIVLNGLLAKPAMCVYEFCASAYVCKHGQFQRIGGKRPFRRSVGVVVARLCRRRRLLFQTLEDKCAYERMGEREREQGN